MNLLFKSFRTVNRNLGMIWPPFVASLGFAVVIGLLLLLLGFSFARNLFKNGFNPMHNFGTKQGLDPLGGMPFVPGFSPDHPSVQMFAMLFLFIGITLIVELLFFSFLYGGMFKLASSVLDGQRKYWSSFYKGGIKYLGWGLLFFILCFAATMVLMFVLLMPLGIAAALLGSSSGPSVAVLILTYILSIAVYYLFLMFFPAMIDGGEEFGQALATSFRLSWKAFLKTILPGILLVICFVIIYFAVIGISYLTHPIFFIILMVPVYLYLTPLLFVWLVNVYRDLKPRETSPFNPVDPTLD